MHRPGIAQDRSGRRQAGHADVEVTALVVVLVMMIVWATPGISARPFSVADDSRYLANPTGPAADAARETF
jgi:hypothetical protein